MTKEMQDADIAHEFAEKIVPEHKTHLEFKDNMKVLLDITHDHLRAMDEGDIEISVLSTTSPGLQGLDEASAKDLRNISRRWNDYLAKHEDRLKVFAALPMRDPELAAEELSRTVKDLGFVGALLCGY